MDRIQIELQSIFKEKKKTKVQTSKYLIQIEDILFKQQPKLSQQEIRVLLFGDEENGVEGLLQTCSYQQKLTGSLQQSSFNSVQLLLRLLTEHPQQRDLQTIFYDGDEQDFQKMKLASHISSENKNDFAAFQIAGLIRQQRPHLDVRNYVEGQYNQEKFLAWFQINMQKQGDDGSKYVEQEDPDNNQSGLNMSRSASDASVGGEVEYENKNLQRREDQIQQRKKYFQQILVVRRELNAEYFIKNFYDPLDLLSATGRLSTKSLSPKRKSVQQKSDSNRQSVVRRSEVKRIIYSKGQSFDLSQVYDTAGMEEMIFKLHIDSKQFDPLTFLQVIHSDTSEKMLTDSIPKLEAQGEELERYQQNIIYLFYDDFFIIQKGLKRVHTNFVEKEIKNERGEGITSSLDLKLKKAFDKLSDLCHQYNECKYEIELLTQGLQFLHQNDIVVTLPFEIKKLQNQEDYQNIVRLYQQILPFLQKYQKFSIFKRVFQQFHSVISITRSSINKLILKNLSDLVKANQLMSLLLDLNSEYGNPIQDLLETIQSSLNDQIRQIIYISQSDQLVCLEGEEDEKEEKNEIFRASESIKPQEGLTVENLKNYNFSGDMIDEFIESFGVATTSVSKVDVKNLTSAISACSEEISNFMELCLSYCSGDYDYQLTSLGQMNQEVLMKRRDTSVRKMLSKLVNLMSERLKIFMETFFEASLVRFQSKELRRTFDQTFEDFHLFSNLVKEVSGQIAPQCPYFEIQIDQIVEMKRIILSLFTKFVIIRSNLIYFQEVQYVKLVEVKKDFFGYFESQFLASFSECLYNSIVSISEISIFEQVNVSNLALFSDLIYNLTQEGISIMIKKLSAYSPNNANIGVNSGVQFNPKLSQSLIVLCNIISLSQHQLPQIIDDLYVNGLPVNPTIKKKMFKEQVSVKIFKRLDQLAQQYKAKCVQYSTQEHVRSLINEILFGTASKADDLRKTINNIKSEPGSPLQSGQSSILSNSDRGKRTSSIPQQEEPDLLANDKKLGPMNWENEAYLLYTSSIIFSISENMEIRYHALDLLTELQNLHNQIQRRCPLEVDEIMMAINASLTTTILEVISVQEKQEKPFVQQIWLEIQFIQTSTSRYQNTSVAQNYAKIFRELQRMGGDKLFTQEDLANKKQVLRNTKYKSSINFRSLNSA